MKFQAREPKEAVNYSRENPLRETVILFSGLSAAALAAYFVLGWAAELTVPLIPPEWESRLFGGVWRELDALETEQDPETQAVQRLVDRLAARWPDAPYDFRAGILDEGRANALALPGGRILVTRKLLEDAESENELAFVLGHELGHFRNRDHLRSLGRGLVTGLLTATFGAAVGVGPNPLDLARSLSERGFGRGQEAGADAFALELVHGLYGHVAGADDFFERMAEESGSGRGAAVVRWLSTHPLSDDRVAAIDRLARERGWSTEGRLRPPLHP